jgi:hypothetical protein
MQRKNNNLRAELDHLYRLVDHIRARSDLEAVAIFQQIRASDGPLDVAKLLENIGTVQIDMLSTHSGHEASILQEVDLTALSNSTVKVRAKPWTDVAGDGLVSELISSFFAYDNAVYLPFIDQQWFLASICEETLDSAEFCSPLLVNAICALRCVSSSHGAFAGVHR